MNNPALRRSFAIFHLTLGLVIFAQSLRAIMLASEHSAGTILDPHLALFAGVEAIAALLFLIPQTMKWASVALLIVFGAALILHGPLQQLDLLLYAAGVIFARIHGSVFSATLFKGTEIVH